MKLLWVLKRMHPNRGRIEAIDADEEISLVDIKTQDDLGVELQGRKEDDNAAIKEVNDAEPTMFDDEEVTMTMAQTLIKMKAEKARILNEQMAKSCMMRKLNKLQQEKSKSKITLKELKSYNSIMIKTGIH
nr:hypothetical protein [Tanacetum cinerariifolium]